MRFLGAFLMCAACTGRTSVADDIEDRALVRDGHERGAQLADQASSELGGNVHVVLAGKIATMLHAVDDGVQQEADVIVASGASTDAVDFANRVVEEHTSLASELDSAQRQLAINDVPSNVSDALAGDLSVSLAALDGIVPDQLGRAYLELQVRDHAEIAVLLDRLASLDVFEDSFSTTLDDYRTSIVQDLGDAESRLHAH